MNNLQQLASLEAREKGNVATGYEFHGNPA